MRLTSFSLANKKSFSFAAVESYIQLFFLTQKLHNKAQIMDRPFICELCSKTFKRFEHMMIHKSGHSDENPFSCFLCGQTFKTKAACKSHQRILSVEGKSPIACSHCEKTFTSISNLNKHILRHNDERPHKCSKCENFKP